jgi:hypothetical protein
MLDGTSDCTRRNRLVHFRPQSRAHGVAESGLLAQRDPRTAWHTACSTLCRYAAPQDEAASEKEKKAATEIPWRT